MFRAFWAMGRAWAFTPKEVGALEACGQRNNRTQDLTQVLTGSLWLLQIGQTAGSEDKSWGTRAEVTVWCRQAIMGAR